MNMAFLHNLLLVLLAVSEAVLASPVRSAYAVKDTHHVPQRWSRVQRADPDHMIYLQISLKQSQFDELERHLYEVSDPSHSRYGQHLTIDEVNELVRPTDDAL
jgi:tripeptidyl-peptidase-1